MRKLAILSIFAASITMFAPLAQAQSWRLQPRVQREIQSDINSLSRDIARAEGKRTISRRDAKEMQRDAASLQRTFNSFSRDGLSRREVEQLENQVNRLRARLRLERRRWTGNR